MGWPCWSASCWSGLEAGTFRISELLADPPTGSTVTVAVLLILVGAISKSALFPFHFWLPAAMAAPTPVSAYLHAAAMVKAGVYLVALLAPAFAGVPGWRGLLLSLGLVTMLLGGWRALRQFDVKLLLAYGTVSQLGFLLVVLSIGTRTAALAGVAMLIAHALFKATLFMVVGIVDHQTGTRDLRKLSGRRPVRTGAGRRRAASPAPRWPACPPLTGFVAKESVYGALIDVARDGDGTGLEGAAGWTVLVGVVLGSALTAAYTARFLWGTFATKPGTARSEPGRDRRPGSCSPRSCWRRASIVARVPGRAGDHDARRRTPTRSRPPGTTPGWRCGTGSGSPWLLSLVSVGARAAAVLAAARRSRDLQSAILDGCGAPNAATSGWCGWWTAPRSRSPASPSAARWRPTSA